MESAQQPIAVFMQKVNVVENGCWLWQGAPTTAGYGLARFSGTSWYAHRLSYLLFRTHPGDKFVCHKCDTPMCVNPEHLFLGSAKENTRDAINKGRPIGRRTKINAQTIQKIKDMLNDDVPQRWIKELTEVSQATISEINRGIRKYAL